MMRRCCGEDEHGTPGILWIKYSLKRLCPGRSRASRLCSHDYLVKTSGRRVRGTERVTISLMAFAVFAFCPSSVALTRCGCRAGSSPK